MNQKIVRTLLVIVIAMLTFGISLPSRAEVVFRAKREEYRGKWNASVLENVRQVLEKRARSRGLTEATFTVQMPDRIVARITPAKVNKSLLRYLTAPARLEFTLLPQLGSRDGSTPPKWNLSQDAKTGHPILIDQTTARALTQQQMEKAIFHHLPILTEKDLLPHCKAVLQPAGRRPLLEIELTANGSRILEAATRANLGKSLAIFLDRRLLTAPTINSPISGGKAVIEGDFTPESVTEVAAQLNAGSLPVPIEILSR